MTKTLKFLGMAIVCVAIVALFFKFLNSYPPSAAGAFEWEKTVRVYFIDREKLETSSCEADVALERRVINAETLGPGAIEALLKGLLDTEKETYHSAIGPDVLLQNFEIKDGVAYIDFNSALNEGVGGSCNVIAIRSQIENTLVSLPDIDSVVISVDGETEGILEP